MKRSSAWMRRLSAGADSASSCAAALIEPRRATWTNASIAVNGGRRRMAEIHEVQAETPPSTISRAGADRKSVVEGQRASVRVDLGGRRYIQKKKKQQIKRTPTKY